MIKFQVQKKDLLSYARLGQLTVRNQKIQTPIFMPVGTKATVKALTTSEVKAAGAEVILCNSYHLFLRPGSKLILQAGGLHKFMNWDGPILTDSGGFQVFSLAALTKIDDQKIIFRSHIDGSYQEFTPEIAIAVQEDLGSDIMMPLDQCVPYPTTYADAKQGVLRTTKWAERSLKAKKENHQTLFGIVQGSVFADLRQQSLSDLLSLDFLGYAVGGLSVGETKQELQNILAAIADGLPQEKPHYLMGVGTPEDILLGVSYGIDMFDCVFPTRTGRTGSLFTKNGRINIRNARFKQDFSPVEAECDCPLCTSYTKAYLHHLFRQKEMLGMRLATYHNLRFLHRLTQEIQRAIAKGTFGDYKNQFLNGYLLNKGRT